MNNTLKIKTLSTLGLILIGAFLLTLLISFTYIRMPYGAIVTGEFIHNGKPVEIKTSSDGYVDFFKEQKEVFQNDTILTLDIKTENVQIQNLEEQIAFLEAAIIRTEAEINGNELTFQGLDTEKYTSIFENELKLYNQKQKEEEKQILIFENRIENSKSLLIDLDRKLAMLNETKKLAEERFSIIESLHEKGLKTRLEYIQAQQIMADTQNAFLEIDINKNNLEKNIVENKLQIENLLSKSKKDAQKEQIDLVKKLSELKTQLQTLLQIVENKTIRAPISGRVMLTYTPKVGEWLNKDYTIAKIVPTDSPLYLEARLNANDIDNISIDNLVKVTPSGIKDRNQFPIEGKVIDISSDTITENTPQGRLHYFIVKISVDPLEFKEKYGTPLTSGMPATGVIQNKDRTILNYFLDPLRKSFRQSFIEK